MTDSTVKPEKITKPIQLLGAWLAGLLAIDSSFLIAATHLPHGSWAAASLVVAAIANVPIFLIAVFLLQTKFRPELQEDSYYATYLSRRTNEPISVGKLDVHFAQLNQKLLELESRIPLPSPPTTTAVEQALTTLSIGVNTYLPDREKIGARLSSLGVVGFSSFQGDKPPGRRHVAISKYLPKEVLKEVVRVARDLGFHRYSIFDNHAEETEEDVLFGSYGEAEYEITTPA